MRKSKLLILLVAILLISGIYGFAQIGDKSFFNMSAQDKPITNMSDEEKLKQVMEKRDILSALRKQNLENDEIEYLMNDYAKIVLIYPITDKQIKTITDMVYDGKDLSKILDIYVFLQDSNASLKYLEPMYDVAKSTDFFGQYWLDDAFNYCAKQNDNVINAEEIEEYINNGISIDDIRIADIMSRAEVKSTKDILNELKEGKTWGQIASQVYENPSINSMNMETDGSVVMECLVLSKCSNEDVGQIYLEYKQSPEQEKYRIILPKVNKAEEYVIDNGLKITNSDEYINTVSNETNGEISKEDIKELVSQKHTKKQIKKAVEISKKAVDISAQDVLQLYDEQNIWYGESQVENDEK